MRNAFSVVASAILFAMLLVVPASVGAQLSDFKGTCEVSKIAYATASNSVPTGTGTWDGIFLDVPSMSVTVVVTPVRPGGERCLMVSFSAMVSSAGQEWPRLPVRALLDGNQVGSPGFVYFSADDLILFGEHHSNTFNWIFPDVAAGTHTVKIQFAIPPGPGPTLSRRSLVVHFE
jgi:hypothetical protein